MLHLEGLRKRVVKYYFIMIIITVALFEGLFMFYLQNYYYNSAKQSLISQATYTMDIYDGVGMESASFENKVYNIFEKGQINSNTNFTVEFIDKNKNKIIIVLCGDKEGLKKFILNNQQLSCRFPIWLDFEDYNEDELFEISMNLIKNRGFYIDEAGEKELKNSINELSHIKNLSVKNALLITKFLDKVVRIQSIRVYKERVSQIDINTINDKDIRQSKELFLQENIMTKEKEGNINDDKKIVQQNNSNINLIDELLKLKHLLDLKLIDTNEFMILKNNLLNK